MPWSPPSLLPISAAAALFCAACGPQAAKTEKPAPARPSQTGGSTGAAPNNSAGATGSGNGGASGSAAPGGSGSAPTMPGSGGAAGNNAPDGGTSAPAGPEIPLPLTVTTHFPNQGWFADPSLEPALQGGSLIMQADAVTGPCAKRIPDARGKCLKVVYTPPANLTPPAMGGWVGVFFLTTILREHPELTPPLKIGAANWGAEPGKNIAPGATKISFAAAAAEEGLPVTFKAGTMVDAFVMPEQDEILGAEWKTSALPFAGQAYGTNVVGAFAWVLKDTTKSATFYLDNIVWE